MPITNPDYSNLNHEEMAKTIGLKAKHMPMLIASFLKESTPILENLQTAIDGKDYVAIKSTAHSIKGSAGNLRFHELAEMAKEIEHAGEQTDASFDYKAYVESIKNSIKTIK